MSISLAQSFDRIQLLREDILSHDLFAEWPPVRLELAQEAIKSSKGLTQPLITTDMLENIFTKVPVHIGQHELLVGAMYCVGYPELDNAYHQGSAEWTYMIAEYETLLDIGVTGIILRANARLVALTQELPNDPKKIQFLQTLIRSCNAVIVWAERYAQEAEQQAAVECDQVRKLELLDIAMRCRRVPAYPAKSFADALQSVWFIYVALYLECHGASCIGRLDQFLYPFYKQDIESGVMTRDEAKELLCCLWVKLYENVQGKVGSHAQTVTIGGLLPDGTSGVNDLSFLCIDVAAQMGNVGAQIAVRWSKDQTPELFTEALKLIESRVLMPQVFNDDTYISALGKIGVPYEDACQYAIFGCHEPCIAGMGYQRPASWPGYVSFYRWVESALGLESYVEQDETIPRVRITGDQPINTEELWDAWLAAMRKGIKNAVDVANTGEKIKIELLPRPLMSAFYKDCIDNAVDVIAGGARYNMTGFQGMGLATAVDAFLVVKELVFDQKLITMSNLVDAMIADYQGYESLRQMLMTRPSKYGRDNDLADVWAQRMVQAFYDEIALHTNARGGRFSPGLWSFITCIIDGKKAGASADGRLAGQPLSHSMDPSPGQATEGPAAAMQSVLKLKHDNLTNGGSFLLEFLPSVMADSKAKGKVQALCETYLRMGGIEMQLSCSSTDELLEAQKNPDKYKDLVVRVAGYSDFFVRQDPTIQDYIIQREKHLV